MSSVNIFLMANKTMLVHSLTLMAKLKFSWDSYSCSHSAWIQVSYFGCMGQRHTADTYVRTEGAHSFLSLFYWVGVLVPLFRAHSCSCWMRIWVVRTLMYWWSFKRIIIKFNFGINYVARKINCLLVYDFAIFVSASILFIKCKKKKKIKFETLICGWL